MISSRKKAGLMCALSHLTRISLGEKKDEGCEAREKERVRCMGQILTRYLAYQGQVEQTDSGK